MRNTLVVALTGGAIMALLASAPCSVAGNSSHAWTVKSAVVRAPKGTLGPHMSTWHRYPAIAGRSRWVGARYYGAAYYHPHYGAAYYRPDYAAAYYGPDYAAAYYRPDSFYAEYTAADPDAVPGNWPMSPPVPAADPPPNRVVQFPVTIFYEYHPHWTVNPF
jgi:hypothetical protein